MKEWLVEEGMFWDLVVLIVVLSLISLISAFSPWRTCWISLNLPFMWLFISVMLAA